MDHTFDHGWQVMASAMVVPKTLQLYTMGAYIFGEFGDPWEVTAGLNWWIFKRREIRLNLEYIYDRDSPIGYTAVPQVVGGTGSIFSGNLESPSEAQDTHFSRSPTTHRASVPYPGGTRPIPGAGLLAVPLTDPSLGEFDHHRSMVTVAGRSSPRDETRRSRARR
jgi:hypothetical protein